MSGIAFPKSQQVFCDPYLDWLRSQSCAFCKASPRSQAHHHPPTGRRGVVNDLNAIPTCVRCHMRCHGQKVEGKPPISPAHQQVVIVQFQRLFWERGHIPEREQVLEALQVFGVVQQPGGKS